VHRSRDGALIYAAGFIRSTTVGLVGVVLAMYLSQLGLSTAALSALGYLAFALSSAMSGSRRKESLL